MVQNIFSILYKGFRKAILTINIFKWKLLCHVMLYGQNVNYCSFSTVGLPFISISIGGKCNIGYGFNMNNTLASNPIGRSQRCIIFVDKNACLKIGNNVGISQTAIVCCLNITIGNNVKIGGGVCIYDTDFHSLDAHIRKNFVLDMKHKRKRPVLIKDNAFIGAHSTILKGVTIGENSVVGACSVVTKDIPDNEVWAGNPAKFIMKLPESNISMRY